MTDRSDEDVLAEMVAAFGPASLQEPRAEVCDECWRMICPGGKPVTLS